MCRRAHGVSREEKTVGDGDDLEQVTKRAVYANCRIGEIRVGKGQELLEVKVPGSEHWLQIGQAIGGVDESLKRQMIRRTIEEHLKKELRLAPHGIKVLSLFFIDRVERYRQYDADGNPVRRATMRSGLRKNTGAWPGIRTTRACSRMSTPHRRGRGARRLLLAMTRKARWTDTAENNQGNRENAERAYNLIMKDKEKLLSFESKLKFIFSHSALREGWDNPNVFQICALREMGTERERRQTIGRGLRLCVNQQGERLRGFDVNTLTVIATESYEEFAENLQKEIEKDTGIHFGIVEKHQFASIPVTDADGQNEGSGRCSSPKRSGTT